MKIMIGYHGFATDSDILKIAVNHAKAFNAQVYLVTSVQIGEDIPKAEFDMAEQNLEEGKNFLIEMGIDCVGSLLETGRDAGEDLIRFASEQKMDELIIGIENRSKLGKFIFGSTAQHVILNAPCPVLCVRHDKD